MKTFKRVSDYQKEFIRSNSARMYIATMAERLKMSPDTVREFMKHENLPKFQPVKKKRYGKDKKDPDHVPPGYFNVQAMKNWLMVQ